MEDVLFMLMSLVKKQKKGNTVEIDDNVINRTKTFNLECTTKIMTEIDLIKPCLLTKGIPATFIIVTQKKSWFQFDFFSFLKGTTLVLVIFN